MPAERGKNAGQPVTKIRLVLRVLVLTLVVFGIIGAVVTLLPQIRNPHAPEEKVNIPQARQIDRETLQKKAPAAGP